MKILFIGDIFAKGGRKAVRKFLPDILEEHEIELVIANGENVSHGKGLLPSHYEELMDEGVDFFTLGNHAFAKKEIISILENEENIVRPANISNKAPGVGSREIDVNGTKVRITNVMGSAFISELLPQNPYVTMEEILKNNTAPIHIVDFHGEATGEKVAFAFAFNGKVSAVLGTHTHVQTADDRILSNGTAYISDIGMCGSYNSAIGTIVDDIIYSQSTGLPRKKEVDERGDLFNAVLLDIDDVTGKAKSIERINIHP